MAFIKSCELPEASLLREYLDRGAYTDCYTMEIARPASLAEYIVAFYTTAVFKLERLLLAWFVARPSTDAEVQALASGQLKSFAAWDVEAREPSQILLTDYQGRTRSWLMSTPSPDGQTTKLFFGSAVVPVEDRRTGQNRMGSTFRALLGFHKLYSRVLLHSAVRRLSRSGRRAHRT